MAGRSDIEAGKAVIRLWVENSALVKGLQAAKAHLQSLGSNVMRIGGIMSGMGTAVVAPIAAAVGHFMEFGGTLADASVRTSVAASTLAEYAFAAEQTGATLGDVESALIKMQKNGFKPGQFDALAEEITAIEDPVKRIQRTVEIFGKGGPALLPMMASLRELRAEAQKLGVAPTDEAVQNADALGDAFDAIKKVISATIFEIGAALGPALLPAMETVKNIAAWFNRWAKENGAIIRQVALIGATVLAAGAAITAIGLTIFAMGTAAGLLAGAISAIGAMLGFLLSPLGLVIAGVTALGLGVVAWARYTESGKAAFASLMEFLRPVLEFAREVVGGISDAFMAGDLALAAQIAWTAVLVVFETAKFQMMRVWFALRSALITAWGEVSLAIQTGVAFIAKIFTGLLDQLVPGWRLGMQLIGLAVAQAWKGFKDGALGAFAAVKLGLDVLISRLQSFMKGLQIATKVAIQQAPGAFKKDGQAASDEIKKFLGVDVAKLFGDAADTAGGVNAKGRAGLAADRALRGAADDDALGDQQRRIDERKAELDKLRGDAAAAREEANRPRANDIRAPNIAEGNAAFSTFSAAGLAAQGGGAGGVMARKLDEQKKVHEAIKRAVEIHTDILKGTQTILKNLGLMGE